MSAEAETLICTCSPFNGCDENYDDGDPRQCRLCVTLDGELPCPADPAAYDTTIEGLMDVLTDATEGEFKPVVVCADGSEPFASMDLGHGLVLDLTAQVRRTNA